MEIRTLTPLDAMKTLRQAPSGSEFFLSVQKDILRLAPAPAPFVGDPKPLETRTYVRLTRRDAIRLVRDMVADAGQRLQLRTDNVYAAEFRVKLDVYPRPHGQGYDYWL